MPTRFSYQFVLVSMIWLCCYAGVAYPDELNDEYAIKTAFIYNVIRMVEWPDDREGNTTPISICLIGENYFGDSLNALERKTVRDRPLVLKKNIQLNTVKNCHLLFISASERNNLATIFRTVARLSVLTVGDVDSFAEMGGIVNLWRDEERIKVEVNLSAAEKVNLKISSRLLQLARVIQ
ncbi:YfiR family protein [Beggiatoa leptomitoformis]|uniref:DUF4154 domain-containing protein n=1 Tax=Beggiatoa leptomitoformis TaxID=288004 RepID=A0A2N9YCC5_9GAMM|nr:YfiR family protein [Beggiatoa leptomitoformis]ALG66570.1 DUF4154 domain-containing protein [Beggiatoa leptomitoformis]AUI68130.1 DUF4154 domain-containing protein [Beggiatoa leptomitoformis]